MRRAPCGGFATPSTRIDPGHARPSTATRAAYQAKLRRLDREIAPASTGAPSQRKLVTDHDAFGYFADRYGITVVGAVIPSQTHVRRAVRRRDREADRPDRARARARRSSPRARSSPKLAERSLVPDRRPLGLQLYSDTLGPAGSSGATYLAMERANADAMVRGFTGGRRVLSLVSAAAMLAADGLAVGYGGPPGLDDVSFELDPGERIGVLGPNGGGKSTLFASLLGELRPRAGSFQAGGRFGYLPQTERSRLDYPVSALDVALMGTLSAPAVVAAAEPRDRGAALDALDRVGLAELARTRFGELSGGQRQRALVARALVQDAPILLLDEPFTGVDQRELRAARAPARRACRRRARPPDRDARPRPGARLGQGALPQPPPDRVRPPAETLTPCGARGDLRGRDRHDPAEGGREPRSGSCLRTITTTHRPRSPHCRCLQALSRPVDPGLRAHAFAALALPGSPAARSAAGSSSTSSPTARSRSRIRSFPASSSLRSAASRSCSAAPPAARRRGRDRVFGRTPEIGADTSVAVVVTTLFGARRAPRAFATVASRPERAPVRERARVSPAPISRSRQLTAGVRSPSCALLHRRLLLVGFDRGSARALGARPLPVDLALLALIAPAVLVGVQALGTCSSSRSSSGRRRARGSSPGGSCR